MRNKSFVEAKRKEDQMNERHEKGTKVQNEGIYD